MQNYELPVIYEHEGGVLAIQLPEDNIEAYFTNNEKIIEALATCGLSPKLAVELLLRIGNYPPYSEEDQFTEGEPKLKTEHVVTKIIRAGGKEIPVLDIGFYPPAASSHPISSIFTNTAEIILGLAGSETLEIVPVISDEENVRLSDNRVNINIGHNTLVVLPPNVQGNRWISFGPNTEIIPSLHALFVAYPTSYSQAAERPISAS